MTYRFFLLLRDSDKSILKTSQGPEKRNLPSLDKIHINLLPNLYTKLYKFGKKRFAIYNQLVSQ